MIHRTLRPLLARHGGDVQRAIYELIGHEMDPAWLPR